MMAPVVRLVGAMLLALMIAACATVPESDRQQLMLLSPEAETEMGLAAFQELREDLDLIQEGEDHERLQRVGRRIAEVAEPLLQERGFEALDWEFHLADADEPNAFVLPGGKVVFYKGILPILEDEEGVAAVMGHEVAHVIGRHSGERLSQHVLTDVSLTAAYAALGGQDASRRGNIMAALGVGATVGIHLPFSRAHEREADEIGLTLMARAGYDPRAAVRVWERMAEEGGARGPEFLSTHPAPENRAQNLQEMMPEALEEYRESEPEQDT